MLSDEKGKVRIWDTVNKEHILKNEFQPFIGVVRSIAWSAGSDKLLVGGQGNEKYMKFYFDSFSFRSAVAFNADTGSSIGAMVGIGQKVNSVGIRPTRPYRAIVGDDNGHIGFFTGVPFEFKTSIAVNNFDMRDFSILVPYFLCECCTILSFGFVFRLCWHG